MDLKEVTKGIGIGLSEEDKLAETSSFVAFDDQKPVVK
jgi:hypothetical protein